MSWPGSAEPQGWQVGAWNSSARLSVIQTHSHRHERALRCRPPAMVESGNLSPTGYVTAGATTGSHLLRFQPRPMDPLQPASEPGSTGGSPEFASVLMNRCPLT